MKQAAVKKLKKSTKTAQKQVEAALRKRRRQAAAEIRAISREQKSATNAQVRNQLYKKLNYWYAMFAQDTNDILYKQVSKIAKNADYEAQDDADHGGLMKFDKKRIENYWATLTPSNSKYLVATMTDKMSDEAVRGLRTAFTETLRAAQLEQWTAKEVHKHLQQQWDVIAGNLEAYRFVDVAGRPWSNAQYLNMVTRTALQRVNRESYMDTLAEMGNDLVRIAAHGDNCPVCNAWSGLVLSMSGQDGRFPSYNQALAAGWAHPCCDCTTDAVIDGPDDEMIEEQAGLDTPKNTDNAEKMQRYNDRVAMKRIQREKGMTAKQAHDELIREKMKKELNIVGMGRVAGEVDALPDGVLAQMQTDKVPRIELTKKRHNRGRNMNSQRGGIIYLDRDKSGQLKGEFLALQTKRGIVQTAPVKVETVKVKPAKQVKQVPDIMQAVEKTAKSIAALKKERFVILKSDGSMKFKPHNSGVNGGTLPDSWYGNVGNCTLVHNHPSCVNRASTKGFGSSFSVDDIRIASTENLKRIVVVTTKRNYVMERPLTGWPTPLEITYAYKKEHFPLYNAFSKKVTTGKLEPGMAQAAEFDMIWKKASKKLDMVYYSIKR